MDKKQIFALAVGTALITAGAIGFWNDVSDNGQEALPHPEQMQPEFEHALRHEIGDGGIPENGIILSACTKDGYKVGMNVVIDGPAQPLTRIVKELFTETAQSFDQADTPSAAWQEAFGKAYISKTTGVSMPEGSGASIMHPKVSAERCAP